MLERVRLLEGHDVEARKALREEGLPAREQEIDAGGGKEIAQSQRQGHGQEGVPDPVVRAHHQHPANLLAAGPAAAQREDPGGRRRQEPRRDARRRVQAWIGDGHASTASHSRRTRSAGRSRMHR